MELLAIEFQRTGSEQVFNQLVDKVKRPAYGRIYSILRNRWDAEEAFNSFLMILYKKIKLFNSNSKFSTWMYRVASNCALDMLEKRNRMQKAEIKIADYLLNVLDNRQDIYSNDCFIDPQKIQRAIKKCNKVNQKILLGVYFQDKSLSLLSIELQIKNSSLKVYAMRARKEFKRKYLTY